ncbi:MAG: hypothetical protein CME24_00610 [Gemmatimonadetes bacterium]|nr:hypothetical protein [Gemmatimonadota bacterium]
MIRTLSRYPWAIVAVVVVLVHAGALRGDFHYDDDHSVVRNLSIRDLSMIPSYFVDPGAFSADPERAMYRPVLLTTYAVNRFLFGDEPWSFLLVNLLIHAANAALVTVLARPWVSTCEGGVAGLLFGLHPVATEPVNYVSARSDSLVAFCLLLTLYMAAHSERVRATVRGETLRLLPGAAAALLTKATAIAIAPLLVLMEWARGPVRSVRQSLLANAMVVGVSCLYLLVIWANGFLPRSLASQATAWSERWLTLGKAFAHYLRTLVIPIDLSPEPAFLLATNVSVTTAGCLALVVSLGAVAFGLLRRNIRAPWILGLWVCFTLVPVSLAPLNVLVNDRRLYLPLAAVAIGIVLAITLVRRPYWRRGLAACGLTLLAIMTVQRSAVWASDISLWSDAVSTAPMMPRAQLYLGDAHLAAAAGSRHAHLSAAAQAYENVHALAPRQRMLSAQAANGLALIESARGNALQARSILNKLVAQEPTYTDAWVNLGNAWYAAALDGEGQAALTSAMAAYDRALDLHPGRYEAHLNRGAVLQLTGRLDEAEGSYRTAMELAPEEPQVMMFLAGLSMLRARLSSDVTLRVGHLRSARAFFVGAADRGHAVARGGVRAVDDSLAAWGVE